jgi:hypothetical protein
MGPRRAVEIKSRVVVCYGLIEGLKGGAEVDVSGQTHS